MNTTPDTAANSPSPYTDGFNSTRLAEAVRDATHGLPPEFIEKHRNAARTLDAAIKKDMDTLGVNSLDIRFEWEMVHLRLRVYMTANGRMAIFTIPSNEMPTDEKHRPMFERTSVQARIVKEAIDAAVFFHLGNVHTSAIRDRVVFVIDRFAKENSTGGKLSSVDTTA